MKILVACEFSGVVRRAFASRGHDAWSCDLLPAEDRSNRHIVGDARDLLNDGWDMLIAHPPCTRLCNSGVRWLAERDLWADLDAAAALFSAFWCAPIKRIAVENPVMHRHAKARIRDYQLPAQSIQPWQFGHGETKRTCLWLRGLPTLTPTDIVEGREARVHRMPPGPARPGPARPGPARPGPARPGPVERAQPVLSGDSRRDGGPMGRRRRRMTNDDLIRRLAYALDAALPHLDRDAAKERRAEEGKAMRSVTHQRRAEMAHQAVAEAFQLLGVPR